MVRALLRFTLLIILVAAIAAFFIGYRFGNRGGARDTEYAVGTAGDTTSRDRPAARGSDTVSVERMRETGARIGESVAEGTNRAERLARDAGLTAKIKSKMALDDLVKARTIDVDTVEGAVMLSGTVASPAERERAVRLARETESVTSVTDRLIVRE
ncbi:MAG: BON domain-containing protein [Acidobacteria bacterium]|nr:BON domain-containing protein [Acidobacteriota bacterium]